MSVLTKQFNLLRSIGGDADGRIVFKLAGTQPGHKMTRYESVEVRVTLMIPFTFNGHELVSVVEGDEIDTTMRTVTNITELSELLSRLRVTALGKALYKATQDIPQQMKDVRGTVSNRKIKKKVRATLRRFEAWNLAMNFDRRTTKEKKEASL